jgi:uncharacterized membrane protein
MLVLVAGLVLFIGVHFLGVVPKLQTALRTQLGATRYKLAYTVLSLVGFGLIIYGNIIAHPSPSVWTPPEWSRTLAIFAVPVSFILVIASFAPGHIRHVVGHPMLAGVTVWAGAHLLANGELSSLVLFGAFFGWSLITFVSASLRDVPPPDIKGWGGDLSAIVVGILLAMIVLRFHMMLFGVAIL